MKEQKGIIKSFSIDMEQASKKFKIEKSLSKIRQKYTLN